MSRDNISLRALFGDAALAARTRASLRFDAQIDASMAAVRGSGGGGLDNRGALFPFPSEEVEEIGLKKSLAARWRLKHSIARILRRIENRKEDGSSFAVCGCGYAAKYRDAERNLKTAEVVRLSRSKGEAGARVGVSGVLRCGSPWVCPTCATHKAQKRRESIAEVIDRTSAMGGVVAFVTLTVRHKAGQALKDLKAIQATAARRARQGRRWLKIKDKAGILGVVQGVEVLYSDVTGWHYHSHMAVPALSDPDTVRAAMCEFVDRYIEEVRKAGGDALWQGQDIQIVHDADDDGVAEYIAKGSASWEVAGSLKEARSKTSKTPWDLAKLAAAGDAVAEKLFVEYCHAMSGTRTCVISKELAAVLHMDGTEDDGDKPTVDPDEEEVVVEIMSGRWGRLMSYGMAWSVIRAVENGQVASDVEVLVSDLIADIDCREAAERAEREAPRQHLKVVDAREVAADIFGRRYMGWSEAVREVTRDIRRFKPDAVMPSMVEVGRIIARLGEAAWRAK